MKEDTGSTKVQIENIKKRVKKLQLHLAKFKKDHSARRALVRLVHQRRKLERYLSSQKTKFSSEE